MHLKMYMRMYVSGCVYTYMYLCICVYVWKYFYVCVWVYDLHDNDDESFYVYVHICIMYEYIHVCIRINMYISCMRVCEHINVCMYVWICTSVCMYVCMYWCEYAYTHAHLSRLNLFIYRYLCINQTLSIPDAIEHLFIQIHPFDRFL